jgi:hypothetical protein
MAQAGWNIIDTRGRGHQVGLYHGDGSGHVVVYCDRRIIQIDFSVLESRSYSFFIEDELYELTLDKQPNGQFVYQCKVNEEADTPRNQAIKAEQKQDRRYMRWVLASMFVLLTAFFCFSYWARYHRAPVRTFERVWTGSQASPITIEQLRKSGKTTTATLTWDSLEQPYRLICQFEPEGRSTPLRFVSDAPNPSALVAPTGFELLHKDAFRVYYNPDKPEQYFIDFEVPDTTTIESYMLRAIAAEMASHPAEPLQSHHCKVQVIVEKYGWKALPAVISQHIDTYKQRYLQMITDPATKTAIDIRCY